FIVEHGADAAIARADVAKATREAERDRAALLDDQGADANNSAQKIELIRKDTA
ncbi:MAG: (E)-4-hydroxy-3-methylbut-2-enyl-diphosphate synthase, partial [Actinomycetota bacterium]